MELILTMDVDSDQSVMSCIAGIHEPIDVLVNNAGVAPHGSIEELPMEVFRAAIAISEAVAGEVKPFNIRVAIVQPGVVDTRMARGSTTPPVIRYPQVTRFSGLFRAALAHPTPPDVTAATIRGIIESGSWQLRHPSGPDAAPFLGWRASMTDEQWVTYNAADDDTWYAAVQNDFGLDARKGA